MGKDQGGCCTDIFSEAQVAAILRQMKRGSGGPTLERNANIIPVESVALSGLHLLGHVKLCELVSSSLTS